MEKIQRELLKSALYQGLINGVFFTVFALVVVGGTLERIVPAFFVGISLACFLAFYLTYRLDWIRHLKLEEKYGADYVDLAHKELDKSGMKKMLKDGWFCEKSLQDRKGELNFKIKGPYKDN